MIIETSCVGKVARACDIGIEDKLFRKRK